MEGIPRQISSMVDAIVKKLLMNWSTIEASFLSHAWELGDTLFAPRLVIRQLVIATLIQAGIMSTRGVYSLCKVVLHRMSSRGRKLRQIEEDMANSLSYKEWVSHAEELDELQGLNKWREDDQDASCNLFNLKVLKRRISDIRSMMNRGDIFDIMFRLRSGLARDQFGTLNNGLYSKASAGTKKIIEEYQNTVCSALKMICSAEEDETEDDDIPTDAKLAFFNETRHSYGRTALLLSGGAALGYYHMGLVRTLYLEGLLPRVISGASAGSLMAAIIGTCTDGEMDELCDVSDPTVSRFRTDFFCFPWEKERRPIKQFHYLLPQNMRWMGSAIVNSVFNGDPLLKLDTEHLIEVVKENTGYWTFQEAFDRTGRIINITVAPLNSYDPPRLLNYLTAPHVCVWSAAVASCAIPGVFDSVDLVVKEPNGDFRRENEWTIRSQGPTGEVGAAASSAGYSDGSVEADLPMQQLSELFNVNHFIVSQVNPHSALLSTLSLQASIWSNPIYGTLVGYLRFLKAQCRDWLKNLLNLFIFGSARPSWSARRGFSTLLTQDYEGRDEDITIMPWKGHRTALSSFAYLIKNPTVEEYNEILLVGERNTWPNIPRIRAHCKVERTLDDCVNTLRKRIHEQDNIQGASMDRTPSFYTSRSIVNLSGLSVADPLPHAADNTREGAAEDIDTLLTDSVPGPSIPLQRSTSVGLQKKGSDSKLHKTTSMANFYYKRTHSDEQINSLTDSTAAPQQDNYENKNET